MRVSIVGFGRFGQLLAQLFKSAFEPTTSLEVTSRTDRAAVARATGLPFVPLSEAARAHVVVLCVPVRELAGVLHAITSHLQPGALVMDTCSVKTYAAEKMVATLPENVSILATHPLFGPDGVRDHGIAGQTLVSCPIRVPAEQVATVEGWFAKLGVKIVRTTPEEHDRQMAITQGLVHFLGRSVERAGLSEPALTTNNARRLFDLARSVVNDSPELFQDLESLNPFARETRQAFLRAAQDIDAELATIKPD